MAWLWTVSLNGTLGLAAYLAARHGLRQPRGAPRILASVILAWTWATLGMEILGTLGYLAPIPLLAWTAFGLVIGLAARLRDTRTARGSADSSANLGISDSVAADKSDHSGGWDWSVVFALGITLHAALFLGAASLLLPVKVVSDGPIYHLYFAARWWKEHRLFLIAAPFGESAATYFPAAGDLWFTWLMVGWGGDRLAKVGQAPFLLVAALTAYAAARRIGAGRPGAILAVCWFITSSPCLLFSFEPNVDTIFVAAYLLSGYFLLRYALGDDGLSSLALAALAAGGTLATKAIGVVFAPVIIGVAVVAVIVRENSLRQRAVGLVLSLLLPVVMAGYWYGRNMLLTGNPLYPLHAKLFGREILAGWYDSSAMRLSPYYLSVSDLPALGDILLTLLDPRLAPVWLAALLGAWCFQRVERPLRRAIWACSTLAVLNVALYWVLIPYRTQQRFMLQALGLAAIPLARTFDLGRWLRWAGVTALAFHVYTPQNWPFTEFGWPIPWDFSPVPSAVPALVPLFPLAAKSRLILLQPGLAGPLVAALALGPVAIAATFAWEWNRSRRGIRPLSCAIMVTTLAAITAGVSVLSTSSDPRLLFFPLFRDYVTGWLQLDIRSGPAGTRVAYTGTNLPYYLLGTGLRNDVRYINIDAHRDWLLHDYHREARAHGSPVWPNPRPAWDRAHPDYEAWLANLRSAHIELLVVARPSSNEGPNTLDALGFPIERGWAESHPETFEPLYGVRQNDPWIRIYRVRRVP